MYDHARRRYSWTVSAVTVPDPNSQVRANLFFSVKLPVDSFATRQQHVVVLLFDSFQKYCSTVRSIQRLIILYFFQKKIKSNSTNKDYSMCLPTTTNSFSYRAVRSRTDASQIRSRFLDTLGISRGSKIACVPRSSLPRRQRKQPATQELLKSDSGMPDTSLGPDSFSSTSLPNNFDARKRKSRKSVAFENAVLVHQIPTRHEFSDRIRNTLWTSSVEMQMNYNRNVIEFTAENWDYRQCLEEDHFFVAQDGQLIHPVHLQQERNLKWHFCAVMCAQRHDHN